MKNATSTLNFNWTAINSQMNSYNWSASTPLSNNFEYSIGESRNEFIIGLTSKIKDVVDGQIMEIWLIIELFASLAAEPKRTSVTCFK